MCHIKLLVVGEDEECTAKSPSDIPSVTTLVCADSPSCDLTCYCRLREDDTTKHTSRTEVPDKWEHHHGQAEDDQESEEKSQLRATG